MIILGIDLSGPSNREATALVAFETLGQAALTCRQRLLGVDDDDILAYARAIRSNAEVVAGLDAPLSYNVGGGDRPADAELRKRVVAAGLRPGAVMPPTMTRMAYLTLRGIAVARLLRSTCRKIQIVEVHPGATMALRGAPPTDIMGLKQHASARRNLLVWLQQQGLKGIGEVADPSDHYVAACAAALAAWRWYHRDAVWLHRAAPPLHPFDYAG
ncbi:MAG: DUF429 domain-containing protein [Desulfosarcinaceae bacterium]|nr:DUF429 domain-containing protein [Desulfosarcinaceae bacterium]